MLVFHSHFVVRLLQASVLSVLTIVANSCVAEEDDDAAAVFKSAGVTKGLCVHLGGGRAESPALTAALAESSNMLVHCLAFDDASLERAKKVIVARKVFGRAMAEKLEGKALPYVPDLANIIVVEDFAALSSQGVSKEEILRVLAPGGTLCVRVGQEWKTTVKPRPTEMDEWTHPLHGADGNLVSTDRQLTFPVGLRWMAGVPWSIGWPRNSPGLPAKAEGNGWASCRGWVVAGGRLFTLGSNEFENLGVIQKPNQYLSAYDAWNGIPLWKLQCDVSDPGYYLNPDSIAALATDGQRVYVGMKNKAVAVDAASGKVAAEFSTQFAPAKLIVLNGVLVVSSWKEKADAMEGKGNMVVLWGPKDGTGNLVAFDAGTGKQLWSKDFPATRLAAAGGVVYVDTGTNPGPREIVAIDLKGGQEKWRQPHTTIGANAKLGYLVAGPGYVVAGSTKGTFVLASDSGKRLWEPKVGPAGAFITDGLLCASSGKCDPLTGSVKAPGLKPYTNDNVCQASSLIANRYITSSSRRGFCFDLEKGLRLDACGSRGACIEGITPANGMLYTGPNRCGCVKGQLKGFLAMGPNGNDPSEADFEKPRPVEKGPAFGIAGNDPGKDDWPTYDHDNEQSAVGATRLPDEVKVIWKTQVLQTQATCSLTDAWKPRLEAILSAPVVAGDHVYVSANDEGRVIALEASTGKTVWSVLLGSRLDAPPTVYKGFCLVGCADGWVYAHSTKDGALAWRSRISPAERRMVAWGHIESSWPVVGPVVVSDGVAYAIAGRNSVADGGTAVVAFDPVTGKTVWAKRVFSTGCSTEALSVRNGFVGWMSVKLDSKTGQVSLNKTSPANSALSRLAAARSKAGASGEVDMVAFCENALVLAGRFVDRKLGTQSPFLAVRPNGTGKITADIPLPAVPTGNRALPTGRWMQSDGGGLAVARERIYLSLQDGTMICVGK